MITLRSIDELAEVVTTAAAAKSTATAATGHRLVVGIVGPPGAGKSTTAEQLVARLGPSAALVPMDGFHLPQATLVELGRRDRMGAPDTFDVDALVRLLERLTDPDAAAASIRAPGFDRALEEPVADAIEVPPGASIVVLEGNYLLLDSGGWERVAAFLGLGCYVVVDPGLRRDRLVARHVRFGKSPDAARAWALGPDEANATLVAAGERRADYLIALG